MSLDPRELLGPPVTTATKRPHVRAIMVSTLTGSAAVDDRSHVMGNATDSALLGALREWADVILVGAGTVRAENYGGAAATAVRPVPAPIAVVSQSLDLALDSRFLTEFVTPPVFLTPSDAITDPADPAVARRAAELREHGFEVIDSGSGAPSDLLTVCSRRGWHNVALEGGPSLLGAFIEADGIDKLYLTLDPRVSSRPELPVAAGQGDIVHRRMELENVAADSDGTVFLRYGRPSS